MDKIHSRHSHPKNKKPVQSHASDHTPTMAGMAMLSFGCGCAVFLLMLSLFAVLMMQIDLPHEVLRIPALLSVCLGVLACAATASRFVAGKRLLCGLLCGAVCYIFLEIATFLYRGSLRLDAIALVNAGLLLLAGVAGGVLSAMNPNRRGARG